MMTAHHKPLAALLMAAACVALPGLSVAGPIVPNAAFSLGNSGFTSCYGYLGYPSVESPGLLYPEGMFTVGSNPGFVHDRWADFGDHTTGDGLMMIVNGSRAADTLVWSATVDVDAGTQYDFSAWAASTRYRSPASLAFAINGVVLDSPLLLPSDTGLWQQFSAGWYSGDYTTAVLSLINLNTEWNGNDFALDDIALTVRPQISLRSVEPEPVPEPGSTLLLLGWAVLGLAGIAKHRIAAKPR
jgi:hypothetical protein